MSAETAGASFEIIKEYIVNTGEKAEEKGKILIATVEGDIHDIGKNIVKVLLENYGFTVIDMGKDITPEAIAEKAEQENIKLVGLSALMTTTVPSMEKTISLLKAKNPQIAVMVGGAVLTEDYAKTIGADYYGKDAMASVRIAEKFFAK
jgi:5-methyltetrahydrofolate--homocysteine methyltransferase